MRRRFKNLKTRYKVIVIASITIIILCVGVFLSLSHKDRHLLTQSPTVFTHNDTDRYYLLSLPEKHSEQTNIIIALHGFSDSAKRFAYFTGLHNATSKDIVIYPQALPPADGYKTGWNAEFCCGTGWKAQADDAGFIVELARYIKSAYDAENASVFIAGFSNGAFMSQKVAIDYPYDIQAVAAVSGSIGTTEKRLEPKRATPILLMHGELDTTVPFAGGFRPTDPDFVWLPFAETVQAWQENNGASADVKTITYPNDGHKWHDWRIADAWHRTPEASQEIIKFFDEVEVEK